MFQMLDHIQADRRIRNGTWNVETDGIEQITRETN